MNKGSVKLGHNKQPPTNWQQASSRGASLTRSCASLPAPVVLPACCCSQAGTANHVHMQLQQRIADMQQQQEDQARKAARKAKKKASKARKAAARAAGGLS